MDVHRSRFVPFPASPINALAFSLPTLPLKSRQSDKALRLAVGRANGDIEIWNPARGIWIQEVVFPGGKDRSVEGLAWIQEPDEVDVDGTISQGQLRLFSIGNSSSVTEWDLVNGLPLRHSSGNSSEVWCLAAQPRWEAAAGAEDAPREGEYRGQNLVAGCADGSLVVLSTANEGLEFQRYLARPIKKHARCLCLTFKDRHTVVAGFADSHVRVYDLRNGSIIRTIAMGGGVRGGPKDILVWAVKCLPNGDIVTGDSSGEVRLFDGELYSQLQRLGGGHEADVLAVAVSNDGKTIFSTGIDRRTATYQLQKHSHSPKRTTWAKISHRRHHSHDVKALASFESKRMSVLVSGGVDTALTISPIRGFGEENSRSVSGLPQHPPVVASRAGRLLVSWWDRELWIWQVEHHMKALDAPRLLTKINLKGEENITSASISVDGTLLVVATTAELRLLQMRLKGIQPNRTLRVRKLETSPSLQKRGARLVQISPDGKWIALVRSNSDTQLCRIIPSRDGNEKPRLLHTMVKMVRLSEKGKKHTTSPFAAFTKGDYLKTVSRAQFSPDSKVLVVSDLSGRIDSWVLLGHEDSAAPEVDIEDDDHPDSDEEDEEDQKVTLLGQRWVRNPLARLVPKAESAPIMLTFRPPKEKEKELEPNGNPALQTTTPNPHPQPLENPKGEYHLVVVTAKHQIYEFDLLRGGMTDWSNRNTANLPADFKSLRDRVMGSTWHATSEWQRLWLYGSNWVLMLDMSQDFEDANSDAIAGAESSKKRKRRDDRHATQLNTSGAGSKKRVEDMTSLKRRAKKLTEDKWNGLDQPLPDKAEEMDDDDDLPPLTPFRPLDEADGVPARNAGRVKWWHTLKYRPILGMVPLPPDSVHVDDRRPNVGTNVLEVVLIERPTWDLDLPAPFRGIHERD